MSEVAVSRQAIDEILALSDRVERNRRITLTYWELAEQLQPVFRGSASWLSFALWASGTAGEFIEKRGLLTALAERADPAAPPGLVTRIARGLLDLFRLTGVFDRVTDAISLQTADGNRLVFTELAHLFL